MAVSTSKSSPRSLPTLHKSNVGARCRYIDPTCCGEGRAFRHKNFRRSSRIYLRKFWHPECE